MPMLTLTSADVSHGDKMPTNQKRIAPKIKVVFFLFIYYPSFLLEVTAVKAKDVPKE
jgi:hypothetical protein